MRDAESFFVVIIAMIRKAIDVLSNARRDLDDIARTGYARSTQTHTGSEIKPTETHINVPL